MLAVLRFRLMNNLSMRFGFSTLKPETAGSRSALATAVWGSGGGVLLPHARAASPASRCLQSALRCSLQEREIHTRHSLGAAGPQPRFTMSMKVVSLANCDRSSRPWANQSVDRRPLVSQTAGSVSTCRSMPEHVPGRVAVHGHPLSSRMELPAGCRKHVVPKDT